MQMLYFNPRERLPLFELFRGSFFDKESDHTHLFKESDCSGRKVISTPAPYDSIHFKVQERVNEFVKKRSIRCKKDCMSFVFLFNVLNCVQDEGIEEWFPEEVK